MELDQFTRAYAEAMLWAETNDDGDPLDAIYGPEDFAPITRAQVWRECRDFQEAAGEIITGQVDRAGHDFWLTRNGHGSGFWDRPEVYGAEAATTLNRMAKACGGRDVYVGDDGLLYLS